MDFKELMLCAGFTIGNCAKHLDVSEQTIYRWFKEGAPVTAIRALEWSAGYNKDWQGFCFQRGKLITPSGYCLRPVEVDQIPWFARMHYSNGMDSAEKRLKEKVAANVDISKIALEYLKKEVTTAMDNFKWDADRYIGPEISLSIVNEK